MRRIALAGCALLLLSGASDATEAADPPSVDTGTAALRLVESRVSAASADGRFTLDAASAAVTHTSATPDGRYRLTEVRRPDVGCDPFPDSIFSNGFEALPP